MFVKTKALSETLSQLAREKPVSVQEDASLADCLSALRGARASCLMVCRGRRLSGIFTERDFLLKAAGKAGPNDPIHRFMTRDPLCVRLEQTVGEAAEMMNERGVRHLPLLDADGAPAGVVTVSAIIQYLAEHFPKAVVNRPPQPNLKADQADGA